MASIVVTGAGRGIGFELVRQLLARGDRVIATYRNDSALTRLRSLDGSMSALTLCRFDVRDEQVAGALTRALGDGAVDVLVNNAGVMGPEAQSIDAMDYLAWREVLDVNVLAPFRLTTALLPWLRRSANPRVVTLSSIMGCLSRKSAGYYAYRSSKAAVNKVMQLLANELRSEGIIVCSVHPGWVRTEMGGAGAELPVHDSACGVIALVDKLTPEQSGRFWQWDGTELPW
jgi:NAD(P)-dependent dehydrogenase (short-subunit alcohol dehydrogenase family)